MRHIIAGMLLLFLSLSPLQAGYKKAAGKKPLKGRYIVTLKDTRSEQVNGLAKALSHQFGGRLLATMQYAMQGFGVAMTEERARALANHPLVAQVEEDEELQLADATDEPFNMRRTMQEPTWAKKEIASGPKVGTNLLSDCTYYGSYYACYWSDDTFWHLDRVDNFGTIYSTKAYAYSSGGVGVRAYLIDTGVLAGHQEFSDGRVEIGANMMADPDLTDAPMPGEEPQVMHTDNWPANNPCGGFQPGNPLGNWSHGTATASVLGGRYTGVAKGVTIVPVKVMNCDGEFPMLAVARGLDWVLADAQNHPNNRAIVNMSFGINQNNYQCENGQGGLTPCVPAIENEINNVVAANIPVFVSANNQNQDLCLTQTPARLGYGNEANYQSTYRVTTVGGTMYDVNTYADQRWTCAAQPGGCDAWGANNPGSNFGACVSIWAPAWNIHTAGAASSTNYRPAYGASSGTSFASPFVAGLAARLLERYPTLTAAQVHSELVYRAGRTSPDFDPSPNINNPHLVYYSPYE